MEEQSGVVLKTSDLYYVCQVVDGVVREPGRYIRHVEDALGDARSANLAEPFKKYSALHFFIAEVMESLLSEENNEIEEGAWFQELAQSNNIVLSNLDDDLELVWKVIDTVTAQVFHVLFANRGTLLKFNELCRGYVLDVSPAFAPHRFTERGHLKRVKPPTWVQNAIFHRDKGRCTNCSRDLTRVINPLAQAHYDHLIPLKMGGMNDVSNLQLLCEDCNRKKGASLLPTRLFYDEWYPGAFLE